MCHRSVIMFVIKALPKDEVKEKKVLEVGFYDVNGSVRPVIESYNPSEYVGVDITGGPGVDIVCNAENIITKLGKESFDVVISTELLEHVRDWRKVISNLKNVCKPNGLILISTRSHGFPYHAYPHDYWRYEIEDMKEIFSDCEILSLAKDPQAPGIFLKVRKPVHFVEKDLLNYSLYSVVSNKRTNKEINKKDSLNAYFLYNVFFKIKFKQFLHRVIDYVFSKL